MVRLFVGLEIPENVRSALDEARGGVECAHWQRDDQLHLTLAFIGDVPKRTMHEIESELSRIIVTPFELDLRGVGLFGKPKQPKNLWAGVSDRKPLVHLHEKICFALESVGVDVERRKYKPHVTLARFRRGAQARIGDWLTEHEILRTPAWTVDHFTLFSSQLTCEGSFYTVESRFGRAYEGETEDEDFTAFSGFELEPAW
ncbi:RNA 2',3'-cyclic phosphodiesterase [Kordiimonas lipolytica]|uniref:RNA 2',3'-cyclic phosphodiesterase n=1 Tax=Kordiimonas lipolytica TaxID=1662421 RepID=A0ABV8UC83_9PROT|nr:RNA 2',3'-cyclic phosphodiesterase [Kordiimonas lipolytica]